MNSGPGALLTLASDRIGDDAYQCRHAPSFVRLRFGESPDTDFHPHHQDVVKNQVGSVVGQ